MPVRERSGFLATPFPEEAARALGKAAAYAEWRSRPLGTVPSLEDVDLTSARTICQQAVRRSRPGWLSTEQTRLVLQAMRLPVAPGGVAKSPPQAAELVLHLGFPVAVKLASHRLVHKTEIGSVHLGVEDEAKVQQAFEAIRARLSAGAGAAGAGGGISPPTTLCTALNTASSSWQLAHHALVRPCFCLKINVSL